ATLDAVRDGDLVGINGGSQASEGSEDKSNAEVLRCFWLQTTAKAECCSRAAVGLQLWAGAGGADVNRRIEALAEGGGAEPGAGSGAQGEAVGEVVAGRDLAHCLVAKVTEVLIAYRKVQQPTVGGNKNEVQKGSVAVASV